MIDFTAFYNEIIGFVTGLTAIYGSINFKILDIEFNVLDLILAFMFIELVILPLFENEEE